MLQEILQDLLPYMEQEFGHAEKIASSIHVTLPVDLYVCRPAQNDCLTLFTAGMSRQSMPNIPPGWESLSKSELFVQVPIDWPTSSFDDFEMSWLPQLMVRIARFPFEADVWMGGAWNILPGDSPHDYLGEDNTFTGILLVSNGKYQRTNSSEFVTLLQIVPLYWGEMELERQKGVEFLLSRFKDLNVTGLLDVRRADVSSATFAKK